MASFAKVFMEGNLVSDGVLSERPVGGQNTPILNLKVAVNKRHSKPEDAPDVFRVEIWRELAMSLAPYAKKGRAVTVIGNVTLKTYIDKYNNPHSYMAVSPDEFHFNDKKPELEIPDTMPAAAPVEDDDDPFAE